MNQESVKLQALPNASRRTKNRIKENGPFFFIKKTGDHFFESGILVASEDGDWFGWLPANEIRIGD